MVAWRSLGTALPLFLISLAPSHVIPADPMRRGTVESVPAESAPRDVPLTARPARARRVAKTNTRTVGFATYYGRYFDGRLTASGTRFDSDAMVAAHPTYPFGTVVRVTNLRNGRSAKVRIVDRGPALAPRRRGVIIDLSRAAAEYLRFVRAGRARVRLEVLR
jgi:rare lipoprotein A